MSRSNKCNTQDSEQSLTYSVKFSGVAQMSFTDPKQTTSNTGNNAGDSQIIGATGTVAGNKGEGNWENRSSGSITAKISQDLANSAVPMLNRVEAIARFDIRQLEGPWERTDPKTKTIPVDTYRDSVKCNLYGKAYFDLPGCHTESALVVGTKKSKFAELIEGSFGRNSRDGDSDDTQAMRKASHAFKTNGDVDLQNLGVEVAATEHINLNFGAVTDIKERCQHYGASYNRGNCAKFVEKVEVQAIKAGKNREYIAIQANGNLGKCEELNQGSRGVQCAKFGFTYYHLDTKGEMSASDEDSTGYHGYFSCALAEKFGIKIMVGNHDDDRKGDDNKLDSSEGTTLGLQLTDLGSGMTATYWNTDMKKDANGKDLDNEQAFNVGLDFCHTISGDFKALNCNDVNHPTQDVECTPCDIETGLN
jgi:hypothetical protein